MSEDKIDFSSLDPTRDRDAWEKRIGYIVQTFKNGCGNRNRSIWSQLAAWADPVLIAAGIAAFLILAAATVVSWENESVETDFVETPASALSRWAAGADMPDTRGILQVLGGRDDSN